MKVKQADSLIEYGLVLALVIGAVMTMFLVIKRAIQARTADITTAAMQVPETAHNALIYEKAWNIRKYERNEATITRLTKQQQKLERDSKEDVDEDKLEDMNEWQ